MNKKGIVMEINKEKVGILTPGGEFIYVKHSNCSPSIGEIYESEEIICKPWLYKNIKKLSSIAASLIIVFLCSSFIRIYNFPIYAVTIRINPAVKLEANRWNKIIKITPLNKDGSNILKELKLKNKSLENAVNLIIDEAKKDNYINENYKNSSKVISLDFTGNTSKLNLNSIENHLKSFKVKYNIKTSDITKTNFTENTNLKNSESTYHKDKSLSNTKAKVTNDNRTKVIKDNNHTNSSDKIKPQNLTPKINQLNERAKEINLNKEKTISSNKNKVEILKENSNKISGNKTNSNNLETKNNPDNKNKDNSNSKKEDSITKEEKIIILIKLIQTIMIKIIQKIMII